jgi:hypothetical protein
MLERREAVHIIFLVLYRVCMFWTRKARRLSG